MDTQYATAHLGLVSSTQDEARRRFPGAVPLLVTASRQHAGRGRGGRPWLSPARGVFASLAFRPDWPQESWARLTLVAGLAAKAALEGLATAGAGLVLKWPNDLLDAADGKVAGLLAETAVAGGAPFVVIGMGANLWWPDPTGGAAGLLVADPGAGAAAAVAESWAAGLLGRVGAGPDAWGRDEYRAACATLGARVTWDAATGPAAGRAVDVGVDGALVVETEAGLERISSGEVRRVRPATLWSRPPTKDDL